MFRLNIIFFAILILCSSKILSQEKINSSFEMSGDNKIVVTYEIKGDSDQVYDLSVVLKRSSKASFEYSPLDLQGALGTGKFAGSQKTITWTLNKKELEIFADGEDYYFQIKAIKKSGSSWLYWVGGIILGGGTAALLLLKKSSDDNSNNVQSGFPAPPGRP